MNTGGFLQTIKMFLISSDKHELLMLRLILRTIILFNLSALTSISAQSSIPYQKVSCLEKGGQFCSDSSVLKIYVRRFERECLKRKGQFHLDRLCDKSQFYSSYCGIEGHNFQLYYSPKHFSLTQAKQHCANQRVGPHALKWHK